MCDRIVAAKNPGVDSAEARKNTHLNFSEICDNWDGAVFGEDCPRWERMRYFLTVCILANTGNIKIHKLGGWDGPGEDFELELLKSELNAVQIGKAGENQVGIG